MEDFKLNPVANYVELALVTKYKTILLHTLPQQPASSVAVLFGSLYEHNQ